MRVLHLSLEVPWPPHHGSRVRTLSQLRLLSAVPEVERLIVLGFSEDGIPPAEQAALGRELPRAQVLPPVRHPIRIRRRPLWLGRVAWLRLSRGLPYLAGKWESRSLRARLTRLLRDEAPDVVYLDQLGMARYLDLVRRLSPRSRVVLEEHNLESDFFRQFADERRGLLRALAAAEWRAARAFETAALRQADTVVAICEEDAAALQALAGVAPVVVPQVIPCQRRPRPRPATPHLCYLGNLSWRPNVRGLTWFCQEVWPLLRASLPEASLTIAGSCLPLDAKGRPIVPAEWQGPGIEVVGYVPDPEPIYARSLAMVAPVIGGCGIRIKVLEALRAGLPLLTTSDGARGLPIARDEVALVEDDPRAAAQAAAALWRDDGLRERLREAGYRYLEAEHGEARAMQGLRRALGLPDGGGQA